MGHTIDIKILVMDSLDGALRIATIGLRLMYRCRNKPIHEELVNNPENAAI